VNSVFNLTVTDAFERDFKRHKRNGELVQELEKKLDRLRESPVEVGGRLHGDLHGYRSTRLAKNYRLIFTIEKQTVTLHALDHRKDVYE
jgi:addiction module RelE/StbE family toxin